VQHILHGDPGHLRHRQFSLRAVGFRHDVADAGADVGLGGVVVGTVRRRLHRGQGRRVVEGQVAEGRQLQIARAKRAEARRVRRGRQRRVVRGRRQRIVREGGRGRGGRVGRVGSRPLDAVPVGVVVLVLGVGAVGDGVLGQRRQAAGAVVVRARAEQVVAAGAAVVLVAGVVVPLDLRRGRGQQVDVHAGRGAVATPPVGAQAGAHVGGGVAGEGVRGRDIRGCDLRDRGGSRDRLAGRRHHRVGHAVLAGRGRRGRRDVLRLVAPPRVGVVVDSRVAGQLVRTAEALGAAGILAGVRLLTGVGADVPRLVLQAVEGSVAEGALVRPGEVLAHLLRRGTRALHEGRQQADGGGHGRVGLFCGGGGGSRGGSRGGSSSSGSGGGRVRWRSGRGERRGRTLFVGGVLGVQQVGEVDC